MAPRAIENDVPHNMTAKTRVRRRSSAATYRIAPVTAQSFEVTVALCFAIRALQCGLAWKYGWAAGLASGLLHFVVAPLSLPICLAHFGTVFYFYFQHYAIQAVVVAALRFVGLRGPTVKFSAMFLAAFFGKQRRTSSEDHGG